MPKNEPTTELVSIDNPQQIAEVLAGLKEMEVQDSSEFNAAQIRRILLAETEEDAFLEIPSYNSLELIGVSFTVRAAKLLPSQLNNGKGAFVAADIVRHDTGEACILTSSASRVAARIVWLQLHEKLPRDVCVTILSESTSNGHQLLGLELVS